MEKSESDDDSEMEELLRQNSEISSSSDEDDLDDLSLTPKKAQINARKTAVLTESPASILAVIMVAFWQLRIPVVYRDLARFVLSYHIKSFVFIMLRL
jgi:RNA polymerase I-specific transcription initiation factor RRN7